MMKRLCYYTILMAVILLTASCSSSKRATKMPMVGNMSGVEYMEKVIGKTPEWNSLSAKASFNLGMGKKGDTHVNGTLRIRRGEVIQLSISPVLGIEVARLEVSPEGLLIVDRFNKRFVRASFGQVSELLHVNLNFHILQSLFLNELFLPGKTSLKSEDISSFLLTTDGNQASLQTKGFKKINYEFLTSTEKGLLEHTHIKLRGTDYGLDWDYTDFDDLHGRMFPKKTRITLQGVDDPYYLHFKLSRMAVEGKWDSHTQLSSRYKEINLQDLLKVLLNLPALAN